MMRLLSATFMCLSIPWVCLQSQSGHPSGLAAQLRDSLRLSRSEQIVGDTLHLVGDRIISYRSIGSTQERVLIRGVRMLNGGCAFRSRGPRGAANWSEWVEEYDLSTCTQIRGRGPGDGGPRLSSAGKYKHFSAQTPVDSNDGQRTSPRKKP